MYLHPLSYAVDLVYLAKQVSLHVEDTSLYDVYQTSQYYEQRWGALWTLSKGEGSLNIEPEIDPENPCLSTSYLVVIVQFGDAGEVV